MREPWVRSAQAAFRPRLITSLNIAAIQPLSIPLETSTIANNRFVIDTPLKIKLPRCRWAEAIP